MIIVGLTGGIASGKTTITNFLKKKRMKIHDSDLVIKNIYSKPPLKFINYLKTILAKPGNLVLYLPSMQGIFLIKLLY